MSSLLEQASLVVTPNGTKASKLYSVKPTDGSGDMTVVRATTATRVNSSGLIESVATNVPRLDYKGSTCPSLLVEPQRTNLLSYSEQFDNAYWAKSSSSVTANATTAPDGNTTADKLIEGTLSTFKYIQKSGITFTSSDTISLYAKSAERSQIAIGNSAVGASIFDLSNGTVVSSGGANINNETIQSVGDGWYRITANVISSGTFSFQIFLANSGTYNYVGDGTSGVYIWGAQIEAGANATSYIPTTTASVTRNADVISKTGITDLIGQTEGTIFFEANVQKLNTGDFYIGISNGNSLAESIYLSQPSPSGNLTVLFRTGVLTPTITILNANWNVGLNKIAIAYNASLGEVFINGVSKGTVALTALPTCNKFTLGSRPDAGGNVVTGTYNSAALWKTRLTNTELATLTTL